jgi:hypothetical protein
VAQSLELNDFYATDNHCNDIAIRDHLHNESLARLGRDDGLRVGEVYE